MVGILIGNKPDDGINKRDDGIDNGGWNHNDMLQWLVWVKISTIWDTTDLINWSLDWNVDSYILIIEENLIRETMDYCNINNGGKWNKRGNGIFCNYF